MTATETPASRSKDWSHRPVSWLVWWGLPLALAVSTNILRLALAETAFALSVAFAWAGTGCLLTARRCRRLHCYFMGPSLWLGAVAAALVGADAIAGAQALNIVVWGTVALAVLSKVPEAIWGRYVET